MFKFIYISFIILIIYQQCVIVEGACGGSNAPTPFFSLASQNSNCNLFEKVYVSNPLAFTSLTIAGANASVEINNNGRVVFNDIKEGLQNLNYTYTDPSNPYITCFGNKSFVGNPRNVQVVSQPLCPWSATNLTVIGDSSPSFYLNGDDATQIPLDQLVTYKPGTNVLRSGIFSCNYYFEVMPKTSTVPIISIAPHSCAKADAKVTVSNYSTYISLILFRGAVNYTHVNGVFSNLQAGNYILNALSEDCGQQLVPLTIVYNTPIINVVYTPILTACDGSSFKTNATFSVPSHPGGSFFIDQVDFYGDSCILEAGNDYDVMWLDSTKSCEATATITATTLPIPVSVSINPPISTISNPSVVTIHYPGNSTDLRVNGGNFFLNTTTLQFTPSRLISSYDITSKCYQYGVEVYVPVLYRNVQTTQQGNCLLPTSLTVTNFFFYYNISLTMGNYSFWSTNGSFSNIPQGDYEMIAIEKTIDGSPGEYSPDTITIGDPNLNTNYITWDVVYITLAPSCSTQGTVKLTPIYNNTIPGDTKTYTYTPGTQILVLFNSQCSQQQLFFTPPLSAFNFNYTLINGTVNQHAAISLTYNTTLIKVLLVNNVNVLLNGAGPFNLNPINEGIKNIVVLTFDTCQYIFNPVVYSNVPSITPTIDVTPQLSNSCAIATGKINIINVAAFDSLLIQRYTPTSITRYFNTTPGGWVVPSGDFTLVYKIGNTSGTILINVPTTTDTLVSFTVQDPTCSIPFQTGVYGSDSYVTVKLINSSSQLVPITNIYTLTGPKSYTVYTPATSQLIGCNPGNYTAYVQSNSCQWPISFTINNNVNPQFPYNTYKTNGANDGIIVVDNPTGYPITSMGGPTVESSNFKQFVGLNNFDGLSYINVKFNGFCSKSINPPVSFVFQPKPYYNITTSGKCGSAMIQIQQKILDNYEVSIGNYVFNSTTPVEFPTVGYYEISYFNLHTFDKINEQFYLYDVPPSNIQYIYQPATCRGANDGRIIITNPDPTFVYNAYDNNDEVNLFYNISSNSFDNLSGYVRPQISAVKVNGQGIADCLTSFIEIPYGNYDIPENILPNIQVTDYCDGKINGGVVISAVNSSLPVYGTFVINGTSYYNTSISLPVGYYQLTIPSMTNGYCSLTSDGVRDITPEPPLVTFNFQIKQASPITIKQLDSPKDNCELVTIQGTGGSGNYAFELYNQNNTLVGTQISDVNGQVKFSIPSSASSLTFKVIAKDQSSCMTSTINVRGDCSVSSSSSLSISSFFILVIIAVITLI